MGNKEIIEFFEELNSNFVYKTEKYDDSISEKKNKFEKVVLNSYKF